ncbi:MAG: tRNA (N(6)-L-threonylcarbamoyladenosine(37)-C(2))-methylthiotransferase MtaB [Defluviitaleaceae bacterium]|nr:tRNA (N(6)-L-threonylcarbamoyladenosine(37)-C(2))-methylthiotransferase MtaB [Defluviitaleaceae bacterium]
MLKAAAHTLGCKVNQCDTEALLLRLRGMGFSIVEFDEVADIYIINTCTVTHVSDKKSRQMIRRARKRNPSAFVAMCGCMANSPSFSSNAHKLETDFIFDARYPEIFFGKLAELTQPTHADDMLSTPYEHAGRTRAFIKIQDGCDRFCSYCIVPYVRGAPKSRPIREILAEAQAFIAAGAPEIVLTGIQVASYGENTGEANLAALVKSVSAMDGLKRLRLSSIDPWAVDVDFLDAVAASSALCSHFHLSLQSGNDATLAAMNRRYTTAEYAAAAASLRELRPEAALTTDVIVGFPGESDADFEQSLEFIRTMKFARVHVFEYSRREGTSAAKLPGQIPPDIKSARGKAMRELALKQQGDFLKSQTGKTLTVLFETLSQGHSENYCPVEIARDDLLPGTIRDVEITGVTNEILQGKIKPKELLL